MTSAATHDIQSAPSKTAGSAPPSTKTLIRERIGELFESNSGQLHLRDILKEARGGAAAPLCTATVHDGKATFVWETAASTVEAPVQTEERTGKRFAITLIPAHLLSVDEVVNP